MKGTDRVPGQHTPTWQMGRQAPATSPGNRHRHNTQKTGTDRTPGQQSPTLHCDNTTPADNGRQPHTMEDTDQMEY